jgi:hypothetical protein
MGLLDGAVTRAVLRHHKNKKKWVKVQVRLFGKGSLFSPDFAVTRTTSGSAL